MRKRADEKWAKPERKRLREPEPKSKLERGQEIESKRRKVERKRVIEKVEN